MALLAHHLYVERNKAGAGRAGAASRRTLAAGLAVLFFILLVDGMLNARAAFDLPLIKAVQQVDAPGLATGISLIERLTSSEGAIASWLIVLVFFSAIRLWSVAVALFLMPIGGVLNQLVGEVLVERTRPHLAELERTSLNFEDRSFPSGHVMGAVLLFGLLFVAARRLPSRSLRFAAQGASLFVIAAVGPARVWDGAHWPSDVFGAYALGGLVLIGLIALMERLSDLDGLPLIRAQRIAHDKAAPHAHALTSLVLFRDETVEKIYAPGMLPRLFYWIAFQAPFPYVANRNALEAAKHRRNLASALTTYWYGESRVASVHGVALRDGRLALVSERIDGTEPQDRDAATRFLTDLRGRFEEAGLPTWQIDPRQPRAIDNLLETGDGAYMVVDLESGLVSPLASLTTWKRAIRRSMVPFFDDIFFDVLRAYVDGERAAMTAAMGEAWVAQLDATIANAEREATAWHESEPRLWSRALRIVAGGFGLRAFWARMRRYTAGSHEKAMAWMDRAVVKWELEGRLTESELERIRAQMAEPAFQQVVPFFGLHILLSIPLRFPFGSIIRPFIVLGALLVATARFFRGRISREEWTRAREIHSPLVMFFAAVPGLGSFAYLGAKPVRSNRLLIRVLLDSALAKAPWSLYERSKLRQIIARPPRLDPDNVTVVVIHSDAQEGDEAQKQPVLEAA